MDDFGVPEKLGQPEIDPEAWVAPGAVLVGKITVRRGASVWYGCVLRSDMEGAIIDVGEDANIQDGTVVHVDRDMSCVVGARVTVGHGAVLHAAVIEDDALIGMGATVLSGAKVGKGSVVAAGAVVPEGMEIPPGVLVAGVPAKIRRDLTGDDRARLENAWKTYARLRDLHAKSGTQYQFPNFPSVPTGPDGEQNNDRGNK
ncbi:MAG: gamma carbonic anhydrase family protein [Candidatus Aminicenantes bacterium]|nr:gamma carbonic anhydrase family protein [Candidatus Aminicenantes bacterium]